YQSIIQRLVKPWYDEVKDYAFPYPQDCNPRCPLRCYGPMKGNDFYGGKICFENGTELQRGGNCGLPELTDCNSETVTPTYLPMMVWATTNRVGCAINTCHNMNVWGSVWRRAVYLVCNYSPKLSAEMERKMYNLSKQLDVEEVTNMLLDDRDLTLNEDLGEESEIDSHDEVEECVLDSETEQDADSGEDEEVGSYYIGKDKNTKWNKKPFQKKRAYRANRQSLEELWGKDGDGVEKFSLVMSINRFKILICCLRFDDRTTRTERRTHDRLAPIRDIFQRFVVNCKQSYYPGENLTIDEMLPGFRGRCAFRQYIPSKPNKYGIKIYALVDASKTYTYNLEVYAGKQPEGPYCVSNKPIDVVKRLAEPLFGSGRNITADNWFTSCDLIDYLKIQKLSYVGTVRKNKRELLPQFVSVKERQQYSSMFAFHNGKALVSYVQHAKKIVLLLSTLHDDAAIDPGTGAEKKTGDNYILQCHQRGGNWIGEAPYKVGVPCSACPPSYGGSCTDNQCFPGVTSNYLYWFK
ncbi:unnamed protein product, partial [Ranitomeya imitator]